MKRIEIASGITLNFVETDKFKTNLLGITLAAPLESGNNTKTALLPYALKGSGGEFGSLKGLNDGLADLYGATLMPMLRKKGEVQLASLYCESIANRYALNSDDVQTGITKLLCGILLSPLKVGKFEEAVVDVEKKNLKEQIDSLINDKMYYGIMRCGEEMCKGEPYALSEYGAVNDIADIKADGLFNHYKSMLETCPIEIFFMGQGDCDSLAGILKNEFGALKRGKITKVGTGVFVKKGAEKTVEEKMQVNQCKLTIGLSTGITCEQDEYFPLAMANAVFGGGPTSMLFMNVREKLSLCYYASSRFEKHKGIMMVYAGVEEKNLDVALNEIRAQLDSVKKGSFSDDEFEAARRTVINSLKSSGDSPFATEDFMLSEILCGKARSIEDYTFAISKVSKNDACAAAQNVIIDTIHIIRGEGGK